MRTKKPGLALSVATATFLGIAAASHSLAQPSADTPERKCFVSLSDRSNTVIYFYDDGPLPDRFYDAENIARAKIPNSVRATITEIHECLLRELDFSDPVARRLEAQIPQ